MRVLVTGATGFLGGALARALAREGAEVHALRRATSEESRLRDVEITWHEADVTVRESLAGLFAGFDWIVHAAGRLGEPNVTEETYRRINVEGTRNVLAAAVAAGGRARVLHLSSPGVLGPTGPEPASEDARPAPANPYERSKAEAEDVARTFAGEGLPVVIARPGFVYGPGDHHVLGLFQAISRGRFFYIGGGNARCQPTHVDDAVDGMLLCLRSGRAGEAYHLVGPEPVTFRQLGATIAAALGVRPPWVNVPRTVAVAGAIVLEAVGRLTGRRPPLSRSGVDFFSVDRIHSWRKASDELGYLPRRGLVPGVASTVAWYREQGLL